MERPPPAAPAAPAADFLSPAPEVRLTNAFARPYDNAVATARTCYSAKGIVTTEEVGGDGLRLPPCRRVFSLFDKPPVQW